MLLICWLLAACRSPTAPPAVDPFFASQGGGEPRTAGHWLVWNACAKDNKADVAAANGGRAAGWILLDDLLADPGILLGDLQVESCEQGLRLLQVQDVEGTDRTGEIVFELAAQLFAAQLNLAAGAEYCPAVDEALRAGQLLLLSLRFDGNGETPGADPATEDGEVALFLTEQLAAYNVGTLCR